MVHLGKHMVKHSAKCLKCNTEIESKYRHNFVSCPCGEIFIDGGRDMQGSRSGYKNRENFLSTSEYAEHDCEEKMTVSDFDCYKLIGDRRCEGVVRFCNYGDSKHCTKCGWS